VTLSTVGSAIGSEASGRIIHVLQSWEGWRLIDAYHALFWIYTAMGIVNALLVLPLTSECEMEKSSSQAYSQVAQHEDEDADDSFELEDTSPSTPNDRHEPSTATQDLPLPTPPTRWWNKLSAQLSQISAPTRSVMYKLWFLLSIDSIADGMVPYSLTNYYIDEFFHPSKSLLGDVTSAAYFLGAISAVFAGPLARKIGLVNTMVFTHIPSSAAVLFFGLPDNLVLVCILLLVRAGLNNMDQAPRSAFIAAVVKPEERTAVMGITNLLRTLAAMAGPSITGVLAGSNKFWVAFVVAGAFRLAYDVGLYVMFVNMKLYENERPAAPTTDGVAGRQAAQDEEMTELVRMPTPVSLASDDGSDDSGSKK
jgi:hypothetical protein